MRLARISEWRKPSGQRQRFNPGGTFLRRATATPPAFDLRITVRVTRCGRICVGQRKINLSTVFAGQREGIREVDNQIWLVRFMDYDLGFFDKDEGRIEPGPNPFAPDKVLTMCPE